MGRKFPSFDNTKPRHFLYIGNHENFLNTLSLNLGSDVSLSSFNPETLEYSEFEARTLKRSLMQRYNLIEKVRSEET